MAKICYISTIPFTIESFILESAKFNHNIGGHDIYVICDFDEKFKNKLPNYINYFPVVMKRGINFSGVNAIYHFYRIFSKEKFDIVQYCTPNASLYASIVAKIVSVPIRIYSQWGIVYVGFKGFKRFVFKVLEKLICLFSTVIQPDSYGNLDFSINEGLYKHDKAEVIWKGSASGVDLDKFSIRNKEHWNNEIRKNLNINSDDVVIGFVGRINSDKGFNELLSVFKDIALDNNNVKLVIVGWIDKPKTLNRDLYEWSLSCNKVHYIGYSNEVEKYLSTFDIFTLPSYREGFGNVIIEAESLEIPVIVTNIPGPTEAMINNVTGIVIEKEDIITLKSALNYLIYNQHQRKVMGRNGLIFVKENFNSSILRVKILENRNKLLQQINRGYTI